MPKSDEERFLIHDFTNKIRKPFLIIDRASRILFCSHNCLSFMSTGREQTKLFTERVHNSDRKMFMKCLQETGRGKKYTQKTLSCRISFDDNWSCYTLFLINMQNDELYRGIILILSDQERERKIQNALDYRRYHDSRSGLINRKIFVDILRNAIYSAKKQQELLVVMAVSFHPVRDQEKNLLSPGPSDPADPIEYLSRILRSNDSIFRYSANEYFILIPRINSIYSLETIVDKIHYGDSLCKVSLMKKDIGISFFPHDGIDAYTLMERSQEALRRAKSCLSDYEVFHNETKETVLYLNEMEKDMYRAIKNNEFIVAYQPKLNRERQICGAEALLRWHSPDKGWIYPSQFLPLAEKSGLIGEIDIFVLDEVCRQQSNLIQNYHITIPVAVNVSPSTFENYNFHLLIRECLEKYHLSPQLIEIEITETGLMENVKESLLKLHAIKNLGVKISIDDFGTGYSSLAELRDYPLDTLKIDKSFVTDLTNDNKARLITESIIYMAKALHIEIVAEGIETEDQYRILNEMGCELYQGYLFGKPMLQEEFLENYLSQQTQASRSI